MKKKLISALAISALLLSGLTVLSACGNKPSPNGDSSAQESALYRVTYLASEDYEVTGLKETYAVGETVTFKINLKNSMKQISSVRVYRSRIRENEQGEYSFVMQAEDTEIAIEIANIATPVLAASYSGRTMVGETLSISATVDGAAISEFTVTAKVGAELVTINGHNVVCVAAGSVVLEVSATKDTFSLKKEVSFSIYSSESSLGQNICYDDHNPIPGIEGSTKSNRGTIITCGVDGGSIDSLTYNKANNEYTMNYANGWEFWSVQLFFDLPYAQAGEVYHFAWDITSDVAGKMTVSGHVLDLQQGSNYFRFDVTQGSGALLSIQLGVNPDGSNNLEGSQLKFSPFRLYDADSTHKYHHVQFLNGTEVLKDIYVRDGQTVIAPSFNPGSNYFYGGFYDGTTPYVSTAAITHDCTFVANLVQKTAENTAHVTIKTATKTITTIDVLKNSPMVLPSDLDIGFGRKIIGYYKDAGFTQAVSLDDPVAGDFDLYLKTRIEYESTYTQDQGLGYSIPASWISYGEDGSVTLSFNGWGETSWYIQANFDKSVIIGEFGKTYTITFTYSINAEGAGYQIYDGNSTGAGSFEIGERKVASIEYEGERLGKDRKLTFELGATAKDVPVVFTLHDISLTVA